jgi:hypothetical protein
LPDDAIVNEQIEQFTARYGTQSSVETIEGTELVRGNLNNLGLKIHILGKVQVYYYQSCYRK